MPAEGIHQTSLREAAASPKLHPAARRALVQDEDAGRLGAVLLDLPYFHRYLEEVVRYAAKLAPRPSAWGSVIHEEAAVPITFSMLRLARRRRSTRLAAIGLGLASHAAIDRQLHPLVNALARAHAGNLAHDAAHREVEKFQSICFHEAYFGRDRMGTPAIARLVQVPMRELFGDAFVSSAVAAAFREAMAHPPAPEELAAMGRGYEQHTALIASPIGALVASEREKERARPRFLFGAWGTFPGALERAIEASVPVLDRAWAVFETQDGPAADEAERALGALLGPGSIDAPGEDVRLDRQYVPSLLAGPSLAGDFTPRPA